MTTPRALSFALAVLALAACGGGNEPAPDAAEPPAPTAETPAPTAPAAPAYDGPALELTITPVGNEMQYAQTEFTAHPGQTVHLTLNNTATNPAMSHNVTVLRTADAVTRVGQAAMSAAATAYVPPGMDDVILAYTPLAAPGQTVEVTFTAPAEAGDYPYICTYPGHYVTMRGTMHVVAAPA